MKTLKALAATSLLVAGMATTMQAEASPLNQSSSGPKAVEPKGVDLQQGLKGLTVQKNIGTQYHWGRGWGYPRWGYGPRWGYPRWGYGPRWGYPRWGYPRWGHHGRWGYPRWGHHGRWGRW